VIVPVPLLVCKLHLHYCLFTAIHVLNRLPSTVKMFGNLHMKAVICFLMIILDSVYHLHTAQPEVFQNVVKTDANLQLTACFRCLVTLIAHW